MVASLQPREPPWIARLRGQLDPWDSSNSESHPWLSSKQGDLAQWFLLGTSYKSCLVCFSHPKASLNGPESGPQPHALSIFAIRDGSSTSQGSGNYWWG